jgi:hypothetical protein
MGSGVNTSRLILFPAFSNFLGKQVTTKRDHANPTGATAPLLDKTL